MLKRMLFCAGGLVLAALIRPSPVHAQVGFGIAVGPYPAPYVYPPAYACGPYWWGYSSCGYPSAYGFYSGYYPGYFYGRSFRPFRGYGYYYPYRDHSYRNGFRDYGYRGYGHRRYGYGGSYMHRGGYGRGTIGVPSFGNRGPYRGGGFWHGSFSGARAGFRGGGRR